MGGGPGDSPRSHPANRGSTPLVHSQYLQRASTVQISRHDAMAPHRLIPIQCRIRSPGAPAIRHYPHRDPVQLNRRCRLRAIMMSDKDNRLNWSRPELHHWAEGEWRKFITPDSCSELRYWEPGFDLPAFRLQRIISQGHLSG